MLQETSSIYPSCEILWVDNVHYSMCISGNIGSDRITEFELKIHKLLKDFDVKISNISYSFFCLIFHYEDRNEIITKFNTLVDEYKLFDVTMEYIQDDNHFNAIQNIESYYITCSQGLSLISNHSDEFLKYKYFVTIKDYNHSIANIKEILHKLGFNESNLDNRTYKTYHLNGEDKPHTTDLIDIFVNQPSVLFPLKCVLKNMRIQEILIYEYDGIKPLNYYTEHQKD